MSKVKNRRAESHARGLITRTETLVGLASLHVLRGDALTAMRLLRTAEQLHDLDGRLHARRVARLRERAALVEAERTLKQRESDCEGREKMLSTCEQSLEKQRAQLKETEAALSATYQLMREGEPCGPPPATDDETDTGVAPI